MTEHDYGPSLQIATDNGAILSYERIGARAWVVAPREGWARVARLLSVFEEHKWFPQPCGVRCDIPFKPSAYFLTMSEHDELAKARDMTERVTGKEPGWSWGGCARAFVQWSIEDKKPTRHCRQTQNGSFIGYHECKPGIHPEGNNWDLAGGYWNLIRRLKHPRIELDERGRIHNCAVPASDLSKWREVCEILHHHKTLRNSVWGTMLGCSTGSQFYRKGVECEAKGYLGTHYAAAALIGRTCWELCYMTSISQGVEYAQTDGVVMLGKAEPEYWKSYGLPYRSKGYGDVEICHQHSYRVGLDSTEWYKRGSRFREPQARCIAPETFYHLNWL